MDRSAQVFFRKAAVTDIDPVWRIILQAKEQMRLLGSRQWQDGYPALDDIRRDIADGCGYVLAAGNVPVAYGAGLMKNRCETRTVFACRGYAGLIFSLHLDKSVFTGHFTGSAPDTPGQK